jgi:hypothetical protein
MGAVSNCAPIIGLSIVAMALDVPWLWLQGPGFSALVRAIQGGRPMRMRWWGAIPVYLALGYLASQVDSAPHAFLAGIATYAVYDFTQYATFDKYPLWLALVDSLWGGVLMLLVWLVGAWMGWVRDETQPTV